MYDNIPKISILIITYNQESVIERAINSILIQKEYVYEIIIGDDCSTDNNWNVITGIAQKYPNLIKPIRNKKNLGIFANMENLYSKPTGDAVFWLAGDDVFCDGLFARAINVVKQNNIDYKNELFCIYFDHKMIYSDGSSIVNSNKIIKKNFNPISLKIRQLICNRAACFSVNILKKMIPVRKDIGIYADGLQDIQMQMFATHSYYEPFIGNIYYVGIGVSRSISVVEHYESMSKLYEELRHFVKLTPKDDNYLRFCEERVLLYISFSVKQLFKTLKFYLKGIDPNLGLQGFQIAKIIFTIKRSVKNIALKSDAKI